MAKKNQKEIELVSIIEKLSPAKLPKGRTCPFYQINYPSEQSIVVNDCGSILEINEVYVYESHIYIITDDGWDISFDNLDDIAQDELLNYFKNK